ncbi:MAG: hypothetical protein ABIE07_08680 [Candidatus Zixiibacteriota bacterium]
MNDNTKVNPLEPCPDGNAVFTVFGRVAYAVQIFEAELITLLIILEQIPQIERSVKSTPESFFTRRSVKKWWRDNSALIESELDRCTLGKLLNDKLRKVSRAFKSMNDVSRSVLSDDKVSSISELLDTLPIAEWGAALERRNYLFHRFWYDADDKLINATDCQQLQTKLLQDQKEFGSHVMNVRKALKSVMNIIGYE